MDQDPSTIREQIAQTREEMGDTVEALGHKADVPARAKERVAETVDTMKENVSGSVGTMKEKITGATPDMPDRGQVTGQARRAVGIAQENPLGLAIGSVALGFLAGMLIPESRAEHERLGPIADQVKDQARQTGQEALERGRQVAQETAQAAAQTARESGQEQAEGLRESAQQSAQEGARYTRESVNR